MRAAVAENGQVRLTETPDPELRPGHLLVEVRGAGVNAADRLLIGATGAEDSAPGVALGAEAAGTVAGVGEGVDGWAIGDRVMGLCRGGLADLVLMEAARALPVPENLSWAEAGGAPVCSLTAHDALVTAGRLRPGDTVLVNAASSGVGVAALQLARLLGAGTIVASSTRPAKLAALADHGIPFDVGVVAGADDTVARCLDATDGHGVDVVIDNVGAPAWPDHVAAAALGARIVSVGRLGGDVAAVSLGEVARKRVSVVGVTFRTRTTDDVAALIAAAVPDVVPALTDGRLRVLVDRTFPLDEVAEAEAYGGRHAHLGKVVVVAG